MLGLQKEEYRRQHNCHNPVIPDTNSRSRKRCCDRTEAPLHSLTTLSELYASQGSGPYSLEQRAYDHSRKRGRCQRRRSETHRVVTTTARWSHIIGNLPSPPKKEHEEEEEKKKRKCLCVCTELGRPTCSSYLSSVTRVASDAAGVGS